MNPALVAARAGLSRGRIEFRQTLTTPSDLIGILIMTGGFLAAMIWTRHTHVPGTHFSLGTTMLVSVLGLNIAAYGVVTMGDLLVVEREDGTLLRAKAIPNGMLGYLVGKITVVSLMLLVSLVLQLVPGLFVLDGFALNTFSAWFTLAWVLVIGLFATMPIGAIVGSLFSNPRNFGLVMLPLMGLVATSGIFYPITNFPTWLQWVAQAFPIYWLGLGMRSAMLPGDMASVEFGQSWRHLETLGVLSVWAAAGLILAPLVLRRMARRESGSSVAARRERALQRVA